MWENIKVNIWSFNYIILFVFGFLCISHLLSFTFYFIRWQENETLPEVEILDASATFIFTLLYAGYMYAFQTRERVRELSVDWFGTAIVIIDTGMSMLMNYSQVSYHGLSSFIYI